MPFRKFFGVLAAFLAAIAAPALAAFLFMSIGNPPGVGALFAAGAAVVALLHVCLIGMPVFIVGFHIKRITFGTCLLSAFLIGLLPITIFELVGILVNHGVLEGRSMTDLQKLAAMAMPPLLFGASGALGGLAFWAALKGMRLLPALNAPEEP